jgi:hypothetical protein
MSDPLVVTPVMRYEALQRQFKSMLPPTKRLRRTHRRHIAHAASLQQIAETAILERALGAKHDRDFIERLKVEVQQHLVLAGARFTEGR